MSCKKLALLASMACIELSSQSFIIIYIIFQSEPPFDLSAKGFPTLISK